MSDVQKGIYIVLVILGVIGAINLPDLYVKAADKIVYELNDPGKMILQITGIESDIHVAWGIFYDGYTVKAILTNTGSSGYVTIGFDALNSDRQIIAQKEKTLHMERNSKTDLKLIFDAEDLPQNQEYTFNVKIISHVKDS